MHIIRRKGATLLISVLVVSAILLTLGVAGIALFVQESHTLAAGDVKQSASAAAIGCMEEALNRLGRASSYAGNETLTVGSGTCTIRPVISGGGQWVLQTESTVQHQTARFQVTLSSRAPVSIVSWKEVGGF